MKLTVPAVSLMDGLRKVLNVVNPRSTIPVLSNVLLSAKDNLLTLSTTDLEVSISTSIEANVETEGETTLPARKFGQIVGTLTKGDVTLETDKSLTTTISCGRAVFRVMGIEASEFPRETGFQEDRRLELAAVDFGKTLKKIAYAVSMDRTRYVLNGILLSINEGNFTSVATDGRRLAVVEKVIDGIDQSMDGDVILPIKVVTELQKLLEEEGRVEIRLSESRASFTVSNSEISSKLVEGKYPNYRQVIPGSFKNSVIIPREAFSEVLNRVSVVVTDSGASIKFDLSKDSLKLSASSSDVGEASEPVEVSYQGDPLTIALNPGFLREPLRNLECDELTMRFNDEFKPIALLGDEGFLYVIMPMRN